MRAFEACFQTSWAITPEALQTVLTIANREGTDAMLAQALERRAARHEAVAAMDGRPLDNARNVTMRDGIAILAVNGPIVRYADFFSEVSGATSVQTLGTDFNLALANPNVTGILLNIDSPGGEVNGIQEFAAMVYTARGSKPITTYIGDLGASAAYWIASAADEIVVAPTALVGSIGVVAAVRDPSKTASRDIEFVSSQSPKKRADPNTEAGRTQIQGIVDALADIFVGAVALHRGVSADTVLSDFGQGGMFVGQAAVTAGLADRVGSFEGVIAAMQERASQPSLLGIRGNARRPALVARTKEPSMATLMERFWAKFGAMDEDEAAVEQAIGPAVGSNPGTQIQGHASYAPGATPLRPVAGELLVTGQDPEVARLRAELAAERASRITSDAEHFADAQIQAQKALPAERPAIIQAYTQFVGSASEPSTAVAALTGLYAQRPPHKLTDELVPAGSDVLGNLSKTPKPDDDDAQAAGATAREWAAKQNGHAPKGA